jgi:hypothetical protein
MNLVVGLFYFWYIKSPTEDKVLRKLRVKLGITYIISELNCDSMLAGKNMSYLIIDSGGG